MSLSRLAEGGLGPLSVQFVPLRHEWRMFESQAGDANTSNVFSGMGICSEVSQPIPPVYCTPWALG